LLKARDPIDGKLSALMVGVICLRPIRSSKDDDREQSVRANEHAVRRHLVWIAKGSAKSRH
jgi:hypothetical protein